MTNDDTGNITVAMIRPNLNDLPEHPLPPDFSLRRFYAGDDVHWLRIHERADKYNTFNTAVFAHQFGNVPGELADRQYYLINDETDEPVGTASAWFGDDAWGRDWGRVHWVAIVPEFQGRGLAKPLMSAVMHRLRELGHARAYLITSTARIPAIRLYAQLGFHPHPRDEREAAAWRAVI